MDIALLRILMMAKSPVAYATVVLRFVGDGSTTLPGNHKTVTQ
jgi:hypothetical protein